MVSFHLFFQFTCIPTSKSLFVIILASRLFWIWTQSYRSSCLERYSSLVCFSQDMSIDIKQHFCTNKILYWERSISVCHGRGRQIWIPNGSWSHNLPHITELQGDSNTVSYGCLKYLSLCLLNVSCFHSQVTSMQFILLPSNKAFSSPEVKLAKSRQEQLLDFQRVSWQAIYEFSLTVK